MARASTGRGNDHHRRSVGAIVVLVGILAAPVGARTVHGHLAGLECQRMVLGPPDESSALASLMQTGDPQMDQMVANLQRTLTLAIYGTLAVIGPIGPALTAWYYASRAKHIDAFCKATPDWAVEVLREAA